MVADRLEGAVGGLALPVPAQCMDLRRPAKRREQLTGKVEHEWRFNYLFAEGPVPELCVETNGISPVGLVLDSGMFDCEFPFGHMPQVLGTDLGTDPEAEISPWGYPGGGDEVRIPKLSMLGPYELPTMEELVPRRQTMGEAAALRPWFEDERWAASYCAGARTAFHHKRGKRYDLLRFADSLSPQDLEDLELHDSYLAAGGLCTYTLLKSLEDHAPSGSTIVHAFAVLPLLEGLLSHLERWNHVPIRSEGTSEQLIADLDRALREHGPPATVLMTVTHRYWALPRRVQERLMGLIRRHVDLGGTALIGRREACRDFRKPKVIIIKGEHGLECTPHGVPTYPWGREPIRGRAGDYYSGEIFAYQGQGTDLRLEPLMKESLKRLIERSCGYEGQLLKLAKGLGKEGYLKVKRQLGQARRGKGPKRRKPAAGRCVRLLLPLIKDLTQDGLRSFHAGTYRPRTPRLAHVPKKDGGKRPISVFPLRDRLIQGALYLWLRDRLSYPLGRWAVGGVTGMGVPQVLDDLQASMPRSDFWYAVVDISKCFEGVDHDRVLAVLKRHLGDTVAARVLHACRPLDAERRGLPQGCPLSVHLLNLLLAPVDRTVAAKVRFYRRYVDDIVLVADSSEDLRAGMSSLQRGLGYRGLKLHPSKGTREAHGDTVEYLNILVSRAGFDVSDLEVRRLFDLQQSDFKAWRRSREYYREVLGQDAYDRLHVRMAAIQWGFKSVVA